MKTTFIALAFAAIAGTAAFAGDIDHEDKLTAAYAQTPVVSNTVIEGRQALRSTITLSESDALVLKQAEYRDANSKN